MKTKAMNFHGILRWISANHLGKATLRQLDDLLGELFLSFPPHFVRCVLVITYEVSLWPRESQQVIFATNNYSERLAFCRRTILSEATDDVNLNNYQSPLVCHYRKTREDVTSSSLAGHDDYGVQQSTALDQWGDTSQYAPTLGYATTPGNLRCSPAYPSDISCINVEPTPGYDGPMMNGSDVTYAD
jgi:hypothetical protein